MVARKMSRHDQRLCRRVLRRGRERRGKRRRRGRVCMVTSPFLPHRHSNARTRYCTPEGRVSTPTCFPRTSSVAADCKGKDSDSRMVDDASANFTLHIHVASDHEQVDEMVDRFHLVPRKTRNIRRVQTSFYHNGFVQASESCDIFPLDPDERDVERHCPIANIDKLRRFAREPHGGQPVDARDGKQDAFATHGRFRKDGWRTIPPYIPTNCPGKTPRPRITSATIPCAVR